MPFASQSSAAAVLQPGMVLPIDLRWIKSKPGKPRIRNRLAAHV
jgi:hypothetical protein